MADRPLAWILENGRPAAQASRLALHRRAVEDNPQHPDLAYNLGVVLVEHGALDEAVEWFRTSLALDPGLSVARYNLAVLLIGRGEHDEGISLLWQVVAEQPEMATAHEQLGLALRSRGRNFEALVCLQRAARMRPGEAGATLEVAAVLQDLGQYGEAIDLLQHARASSDRPALIDLQLGHLHRALGEHEQALRHFEAAAASMSESADPPLHAGLALRRLGRTEEALSALERAIAAAPGHAAALLHHGDCLGQFGRLSEAAESFRRATEADPECAEAHAKLAEALTKLRRFDEAARAAERAIALKPDSAAGHVSLGNALAKRAEWERARECFRTAVELDPSDAGAWCNLGAAHHGLGAFEEALLCLDRALSLAPDHAPARSNRGMTLLTLGDLARGWDEYEWRWKQEHYLEPARRYASSVWSGNEDLSGKTILLHAEQGLGDTIQFVRYLPLVFARGARIVLEVQDSLVRLMQRSAPDATVLPQGAPLPAADYHSSLLSLPHAFSTRLDSIPAAVPYLTPDPVRLAEWRARLGRRERLLVGLCWAGNPEHGNDSNRSVPLAACDPLWQVPGLDFVSLQKLVPTSDWRAFAAAPFGLRAGERVGDFDDTAALVAQLDLVISVDTSVAHLAGALARPVWILVPYRPDWRWLVGRDDSPWYPTARLFRQKSAGDWKGPIGDVAAQLRQEVKTASSKFANSRISGLSVLDIIL